MPDNALQVFEWLVAEILRLPSFSIELYRFLFGITNKFIVKCQRSPLLDPTGFGTPGPLPLAAGPRGPSRDPRGDELAGGGLEEFTGARI